MLHSGAKWFEAKSSIFRIRDDGQYTRSCHHYSCKDNDGRMRDNNQRNGADEHLEKEMKKRLTDFVF
jgi:hypothetical protein